MTIRPCPCKIWRKIDCPGFEDYELRNIIPCPAQVIFLVRGQGEFIKDSPSGSRRVQPHGSFCSVSELRADFEYRLKRTGRDGERLVHEVRVVGIYEFRQLSPAAKDAVRYIVGYKTKLDPYKDWLRKRKWRKR